MITFKNITRVSDNEIRVEYLFDEYDTNFFVFWNTFDAKTDEEIDYYIDERCEVIEYDYNNIESRVIKAIKNDDADEDIDLYIALRDTINELNASEIEYPVITHAEYEDEASNVRVENNGNVFELTVQLVGGEYLGQMGCWITCFDFGRGDINFENTELEFVESEIIKSAKKAYQEMREKEMEGWEVVHRETLRALSATSYEVLIVQQKDNEFRWFLEGEGFTSPNDYSSMPDLAIHRGFDYIDECIENYNELLDVF